MTFRDCDHHILDNSREEKSPADGRVALVQGDTVAIVKREPEIWSTTVAVQRACNCVVVTVTALVTSTMQYFEVRVVCVASGHRSRWRCGGGSNEWRKRERER